MKKQEHKKKTGQKKSKNLIARLVAFLAEDKSRIWLILLFGFFIFLRFYNVEALNLFKYDQVDNAWAAKRIIVDHKFPLIGPADKLGSGIYVGPIYYYFVAFFYFLTNLDPIASPLIAVVSAAFNFLAIFFVVKKIFSNKTAFFAAIIYTVSLHGIFSDRIQWEINLVPSLSILTFYSLYKIISGNEKFIFLLALLLGLSFNIHLTVAVFLPLITLLSLPLLPKTKALLKNILLSLPIFILFLLPILIANIHSKNSLFNHSFSYAGFAYHGLHLRRVLQMIRDPFIEIQSFLQFPFLSFLSVVLIPLFVGVFYLKEKIIYKKRFLYLICLWFVVPWLVLSTYSGEVTSYYYMITHPIALAVIAYFITLLFDQKQIAIKSLVILCISLYAFVNLQTLLNFRAVAIRNFRWAAEDAITKGKVVQFKEGDPTSYMYYYYKRRLSFSKKKSV